MCWRSFLRSEQRPTLPLIGHVAACSFLLLTSVSPSAEQDVYYLPPRVVMRIQWENQSELKFTQFLLCTRDHTMPLMCMCSCLILAVILWRKYSNYVHFINEDWGFKLLCNMLEVPLSSSDRVRMWPLFSMNSEHRLLTSYPTPSLCLAPWLAPKRAQWPNTPLLFLCLEMLTQAVPSTVLDSCWPEPLSSLHIATSTLLHTVDAKELLMDDLTEGLRIPVESPPMFALRKTIFISL